MPRVRGGHADDGFQRAAERMSAVSKTRVIPAIERGCAESSVIDRGRESMGVGGWAGVC